jgi:predicted porin
MNKKLIAVAVAGACVAPAAMAQTANPVTLWGQVNVTMESVEASGGAAPLVRRNRVEDQSSRLGVRGTEDLGGGLKAFFALETAFRADQNNTSPTSGVAQPFATRNSGVGLQGGWGSILMGRWDMPMKSASLVIDPWGDITIGGYTGVMGDAGNFDTRAQNVVEYWSPTWGGVAFRVAMTANEGRTATLNPRQTGASVTWTGGPLYLEYSYEQHKDVSATLPKEDGNSLGGSFTFGPIKLGALYQKFKKTSRTDQKALMGNVTWTMGSNQLIYQYMKSKDGGTSGTAQPDCKSNSLGYKYNFSRRTAFLAQYVKVDNNDAAACNFGSNRLAIANGQDPKGLAIGLLHQF